MENTPATAKSPHHDPRQPTCSCIPQAWAAKIAPARTANFATTARCSNRTGSSSPPLKFEPTRCRSPKQILLRGSPYPCYNLLRGLPFFEKNQHWNGAGIDLTAAVRGKSPLPQTSAWRSELVLVLFRPVCKHSVAEAGTCPLLPPCGRSPHHFMLIFSKNGNPRKGDPLSKICLGDRQRTNFRPERSPRTNFVAMQRMIVCD